MAGAQVRADDAGDVAGRRHLDGHPLRAQARELVAAAGVEAARVVRPEVEQAGCERLQDRVLPADPALPVLEQRNRGEEAAEAAAQLGDLVRDAERLVRIGEFEQRRVDERVVAEAHLANDDRGGGGHGLLAGDRLVVEQRDAAVGAAREVDPLEDVEREPARGLGGGDVGRGCEVLQRLGEVLLRACRAIERVECGLGIVAGGVRLASQAPRVDRAHAVLRRALAPDRGEVGVQDLDARVIGARDRLAGGQDEERDDRQRSGVQDPAGGGFPKRRHRMVRIDEVLGPAEGSARTSVARSRTFWLRCLRAADQPAAPAAGSAWAGAPAEAATASVVAAFFAVAFGTEPVNRSVAVRLCCPSFVRPVPTRTRMR